MEIIGGGKPRNPMTEICDVIEWAHDPLQMFEGYHDMGNPETVLASLVSKIRGEISPRYLESEERYKNLLSELEKELPGSKYVEMDGIDDMVIGILVMEQRAWFAVGCLFGMRSAGRPMGEIRKLASSMVPTEV